jgi:hypothetical protein
VELQFRHGEEVVGVPVNIEYHSATLQWKLSLVVELPQSDKVGIVMTITGSKVELDYLCSEVLSVSTRQQHWRTLQQAFANRRLLLASLNHRLAHL